ncbi:MAG: lysylphosphatidylglycerol synthase transmembrane domain-containing protein [Actinomycetota bacterium]
MSPGRGPDRLVIDEIRQEASGSRHIRSFLQRGAVLAIGMALLYTVQQQLVEVLSSADRLREISIGWFGVMILAEIVSFGCMWALIKLMLPRLSWFVAGTSQLVSNSVSRVVPGGAAVGGATLYRMLAVSGVQPPQAASAMAASGVLSNGLLFSIPAVAGLLALAGAPVPERLVPAAIAGGVFFAVLVALGVIAIVFTRPLVSVGRGVQQVVETVGRLFGREWTFAPERLTEERARLIEVLGPRWPKALAASAGNWAFDYLALIAALYAVGAEPRLSLVLLAYAAASVLTMVPFTPGGVGFVEVGLYSALIITGIGARDAGLATIAYRMVSLWLPVLMGPVAWIAFRQRFPYVNRRVDNRVRGDAAA